MIYLIRHGQTAKNREHTLQGRSNSPLNETGIQQAKEAAEYFRERGIRFDKVYSSPLQRALRTAQVVTGAEPGAAGSGGEEISAGGSPVPSGNLSIITDERLIEMDYGPYEGMSLTDPAPEVLAFFKDFAHVPAPEGMEPLEEIVARAGEFIEELKSFLSGKTESGACADPSRPADAAGAPSVPQPDILISTHAIAMKGVLEYLTPDSHGSYWSKYIGNCEVYVFDFKDGKFSVPRPLCS